MRKTRREAVEQVGHGDTEGMWQASVTEPDTDPAVEPSGWAGWLARWVARYPWIPLVLAFALALASRLFLVMRTHAMIDGDEALVGIQAERILHGQYPTYFYAQPYMGSLEAYLAAILFKVFGPSSWVLRGVAIALSLLLVYLTWRLARALLPRRSTLSPLLAGLAALFAAVPPLYDAVAELRTWGGQIEVYVIILALLLATIELSQRLRGGAGGFELTRRWLILGFLAGLGIWINPLVAYALVACALWLAAPLAGRVGLRAPQFGGAPRRRADSMDKDRAEQEHTPSRPASALLPLLALVPGLAVGGLPAWLYALRNGADNLLVYVNQPTVSPADSGAARHGRLFLGAAITARYVGCVAPRVLDGGLPTESSVEAPLRYLLLLPPLVGIVSALWLVWRRRATPLRVGLPVLYAAIITAVFCLGTSAWGATKSQGCELDYAGRYAVPLALVEPFLLLAIFALPWAWSAWRLRRGREPLNAAQLRRGWTLALLVLLVAGALQTGSYATADPTATFQSPYYKHIALDQNQLLNYLAAHNIHAAWADHWEGNIVTFETNGQTTCADYFDQVYQHGLKRPPGAIATVSNSNAPSFILVIVDSHPVLAQELDAQGIPYTIATLPQSGVTVITPSRTVDPATVIDGLRQDYAY